MTIEIEPDLLRDVTGGSVRLAGPRTSALVALMLTQVQSVIQSMQNGGNDLLMKFLPMMLAMRKGDTEGMMAAMTGSAKPDDKSGDKTTEKA